MILLVYSMRCCRTWGQTTDRKKAGWKFAAALSENVVMILGIVLFLLPILWEQGKRFYEGKVKKEQPVNQQ